MHVRYTCATINIIYSRCSLEFVGLSLCHSLSVSRPPPALSHSVSLTLCLLSLSLSLSLSECIHSTYLLQFQSSQEGVLRQCEHRMEQCRVLKKQSQSICILPRKV